ncbi:ATP-binding protein [Massilia niabensis]|uniref:histidine kinase n=1 Tax=Massilia niabensis TaxID=544910 RepID=A0ABW0LAA4_9BURK
MLDPALYQTIFASAPIGACIFSPSDDPVILDVNEAFLRNVAYTREQLVGQRLFAALPEDPNDPNDTGVAALGRALARVIETGQPQSLPTQRYPIRTIGEGGAEVFVERFWNAVNTPIFDAQGKLLCIYHVTIEVTEQMRAEEALHLSRREALDAALQAEAGRARLKAVLEAAPVGITVVASNGEVLELNAAHDALWGREGLPKEAPVDFSEWRGWWADGSDRHGQPVAPDEWPLAQALRGTPQAHQLIEIETFDEQRQRRVVLLSAAPIRDRDGEVLAAVVVLLDMSERLKAEEALREADRRKDEFLAMLAHELRNPLAPIMVAAELLGHASVDVERVKRTGAVILRQVKHLTSLVDDLLDVSRVTRGLVVIDKQRVDMRTILAQAVEQVTPLLQARRHHLEVRPQAQPLVVCGDAKRLIQVLANLLNNAVKYTPPGGRIDVETRIEGSCAQVSVSDNGIGMSEELITRAFELFAQAERGSDRTQGGLGIGLAVVKRLVELHGGTIRVHSDGPGQGSRFTVSIPLADSSEALSPAPTRSPLATASAPLSVMVVDDNVDAAQMLSMMIEACGYRVRTEHGSQAALIAAATDPADVYLLDIGLPEINGLALAQCLRANPPTRDAVLIAVTGYGRLEDRAASNQAGFDFHFVKPIDSEDLAGLLRDIATRRQRASPERRHGASRAWPSNVAP